MPGSDSNASTKTATNLWMYEKSCIIKYKQKLQNLSSLDIIQSQMKQIVFNKFNFQDNWFCNLAKIILKQ